VVHMVRLTPQEVGNVLGFLRTLMTIVVSRPQTVLVMTDPADQASNQQQTALLAKLTKDFQEQTGRAATVIEPIGEEGAQVIVRRLFDRVDPAAAAKASADYHALYERVSDKFPNLVPKRAITVEYAEKLRKTYPLHPRLLETAEERLRAMPAYQLSRGTLRLFARLIRDLWEAGDDPETVTAGDINWTSPRMLDDLLNRLNRDRFRAAVEADVKQHAGELDGGPQGVHRRVATALLLESLPLATGSGLDLAELTLAVLRPDEGGTEPSEAMDRLIGACWHIYPMGSAAGWQFRYEPNVLKQIEERAATVPAADALDRLKTDLQKSFGGAFAKLRPWPTMAKAVKDLPELQLALCEDEALAKRVTAYADDTPSAEVQRIFRNAILAVTAEAGALDRALQRIRRVIVAEIIEGENRDTDAGKMAKEQLKKLKPDLEISARRETVRAFNRLVLSDSRVLTIEEKYLVPPGDNPLKQVQGQEAVKSFMKSCNLLYEPTDSLHPPLFMDKVFNGTVPAAGAPEARTTEALLERFLAAPGLRVVHDLAVVRQSILRAVKEEAAVLRTAEGIAYEATGAVERQGTISRRTDGASLTTLPFDTATLLATASSETAKEWLHITGASEPGPKPGEIPLPPPPPKGTQPTTVDDLGVAAKLADARALLELRLTAHTTAAIAAVQAAVLPLGANTLELEIDLSGDLKDGGKVLYRIEGVKANHPIQPLRTAQVLCNAAQANLTASLVLKFGPAGREGLGPTLRMFVLPEGVEMLARFAPMTKTAAA